MYNDLFHKYHKRIVKEGILKSFLIAFSIGCGVLALSAFFSWFFGFKAGLWLSLGLFVATVGASCPLIYVMKFRPSTKAIAQRIDDLGLEERVLTMTELENDASYIASAQREDTLRALGTVNHMLIPIIVSAALIAVTAVVGVIGLGSATVDSLYYADVIPSGLELLTKQIPAKTYIVSYDVELSNEAIAYFKAAEEPVPASGYGFVYYYDEENWRTLDRFEGQLEIEGGETAPAVMAVAKSGYVFVQWSDGLRDPYRQDVVTGNLAVYAIFDHIHIDYVEDPAIGDPKWDEEEGDKGEPRPGDPNADPSDGDVPNPHPGDGGNGAGGNHNTAGNAIIDGGTHYADDFEYAQGDAQDRLGKDSELSDEQKDWANDYFESIE